MSIPITIFPILYLFFVLAWLVFSFFNIFHALKFGLATKVNIVTLNIYIIVSIFVVLASLGYMLTVDWTQKIELFSVF